MRPHQPETEEPDQAALLQALAAFEQALGKDPRTVATARVALVEALRADGWDPPAEVLRQLVVDRRTAAGAPLGEP